MPDRTLVVPGTQATTLRDQNGTTVYNAVRVSLGLDKKDLGGRPPAEWQKLLSVDHAPGTFKPARTSLLAGTEIGPGPVVQAPYDRLPKPADFFPYDWRLDMRYNAGLLLEHLRQRKPPSARWNLIGHSQGGIVIVLASKLTADLEEFGRLVARVILVGCPLAGTQRALEAIVVGRGDFGNATTLVDAARGMAQTWPSLYQMLPAWDSVVGAKGAPLGDDKQFTELTGYPGLWKEGIRDDLLVRARETHTLLEGPFARFGSGVAVLAIQGEKQDTPTYLTRTGDTLATTGKKIGSKPELKFAMTKGDTLVPSEVTTAWGGKALRTSTLRLAGKVKEHAFLCDGQFVVEKIGRFLGAPAPASPAVGPV